MVNSLINISDIDLFIWINLMNLLIMIVNDNLLLL